MRKLLLLSLLFLAACQGAPARSPAATSLPPVHTIQPLAVETSVIQPTAADTTDQSQTPLSTTPAMDPSISAAQAYATALQSGQFDVAAGLLSSFSLMVESITRTEAEEQLRIRMNREKWSDFQVMEIREFSSKTILVHVTYMVETTDAKTGESIQAEVDELWPVRLENGKWLYNLDNLIDFRMLDVPEQTTAGLTMKPRQLTRYSDRIRLLLLVQNQSNDPIVLGQPNEIMAAFLFGDQKVEAEKAQLIFDRLRSYPEVFIEIHGQFEQYPDGIVIRQWKNINVAPWFTFQLSQ